MIKGYLWGHEWEQYTLGKTKQLNLGLGGGGGIKGICGTNMLALLTKARILCLDSL
jgi:hypothetical protein